MRRKHCQRTGNAAATRVFRRWGKRYAQGRITSYGAGPFSQARWFVVAPQGAPDEISAHRARALVWAVVGWLLWRAAIQPQAVSADGKNTPMQDLVDFATGKTSAARLETAEAIEMEVGDPIFVVQRGAVRRIGEIRSLRDPETGKPTHRADATAAEAIFYSSAPELPEGAKLAYYDSGRTMEWVLETMLPDQKRAEVALLIKRAYAQHHEEILNALLPLVRKSLSDAFVVVERDLPASIKRHSGRIEELGRKYQKNIVEEKITPLVKQEVWPIVQRHARPMAEEVGAELWTKLPKWGLAWRKGVDYVPFTSGNRMEGHLKKYIDEQALPTFEDRAGDFVHVVQEIMKDVGRNEQFRKVMRDSLAQMIDDPELRQVMWDIVREVIIDNPALGHAIAKTWTGPEAKEALDLAVSRVEPTINQLGHVLFGTREGGFTPEFARVLRAKILRKDRRWFVLVLPTDAPPDANGTPPAVLPVEWGENESLDPFLNALAQSDHD